MSEAFGKYELVRRLGIGGMAEVFIARRHGAAGFVKEVVIKRILPLFNEDPEFVRMFINEARLAAKLRHANIVQVFDFDHVGGIYYIAMEWVEGKDLRGIMQASERRAMPLPRSVAIHVGMEALQGLHYAHTRVDQGKPLKLVHRDISPHNVLVSFSGEVKIADFGIAKVAALASSTRSGTIKGKLPYMSPEQVAGHSIDARSDLFSLGIILWELLAGRRLYQGETEAELFAQVRQALVTPLSRVKPDLAGPLEDVVMRLLSADPEQRYPTALDALEDLSRLAGVGDALQTSLYLQRLLPEETGYHRKGETVARAAPMPAALPVSHDSLAQAETRTSASVADEEPPGAPPERSMSEKAADRAPSSSKAAPKGQPRKQGGAGWLAASAVTLALLLISVLGGFALHASVGQGGEPARPGPVASLAVLPPATGTAMVSVEGLSLGPAPVTLWGYRGQPLNLVFKTDGFPEQQHRLVLGSQPEIRPEPERAGAPSDAAPLDRTGGSADTSPPVPDRSPDQSRPPDLRQPPDQRRPPDQRQPPDTTQFQDVPAMVSSSLSPDGEEKAASGDSPRSKARRMGTLDINVFPWARIRIDGKDVGQTPLKEYKISSGTHKIEIYNKEIGKRESITVKVAPGASTPLRRDWTR